MCAECHSYPCHPRCPNAPEPKHVYECESCEEGICYGDDFVEIDGKCYHVDCLDVEDLLKMMGIDIMTALGEESW